MIESLESRQFLSTTTHYGLLMVNGTNGADRISVVQKGKTFIVHEGSTTTNVGADQHIWGIQVVALGGRDRITIKAKVGASIYGGDGDDLIEGGGGGDVIVGGNGSDKILGNGGNDSIIGSGGRDQIFGGAGDDLIDVLDGKFDRISGGVGKDQARVDIRTDKAWKIEDYTMAELLIPEPFEITPTGAFLVGGGTLGGTGSIGGNVTVSGGHLAPGSGVGTLTVGSLTLDGSTVDSVNNSASGTDSINLSDLGASSSGDYVLIDYTNGSPFQILLTNLPS